MTDNRATSEQYFMRIAAIVSERSTCLRRKVGAIAVKSGRILATGYNGAPTGVAHCIDTGCIRQAQGIPSGQRHELCRGVHAEQNVIVQAALYGTALKEADIYCTTFPCVICAKMLINCGVKRIFFREGYPDAVSSEMLEAAHIQVIEMK